MKKLSVCGVSDMRDWYGCFYRSWTGGDTNSTWLSNWLDPCGTNPSTINTIRYPTITGPSVVCTSNSTFALQHRPPGTTVNWTRNSNLRYISGQGTDNYTVKAYWYSAGPGWVKATITSTCGETIISKGA